MAKRICVIGAGPAGLAFSHAAIAEGFEVELFESHSKPGGCASFFRRKTNVGTACFDAGATVLWGLKSPSDLLSKLLERWGIEGLEFISHTSMHYSMPNGHHFELDASSTRSWISSLKKAFPQEPPSTWKGLEKHRIYAEQLNKLLATGIHMPVDSLQALRFNMPHAYSMLSLALPGLRGLKKSFSDELSNWQSSEEFRRWVDMNLMITLQTKSQNVHPLYAALALFFYPLGAGSIRGGMAHFFETLKSSLLKKTSVHMRKAITKIEKRDDNFYVTTEEGEHGPYNFVVSSIPRFNTQELFKGGPIDNYNWELIKQDLWGAIVGYLLVKDHKNLSALPFNQHCLQEKLGEFYYSWSARNDIVRAPQGYRVATFSHHTPIHAWRENENYSEYKHEAGTPGLQDFRDIFPDCEVLFHEFGTPKTFYRYTKRKEGFVGGFPLNRNYTFFNSPPQNTKIQGLYQIGDTAFPGQSIFGCTVGALLCLEKISNRKVFPS